MSYFQHAETARRYAAYRPKVHDVIQTWLADAGVQPSFQRGLDVACGTGDSTQPMMGFCSDVVGIDQSPQMLAQARALGITAHELPYQQAHTLGLFDFISTCMAFHWFDPVDALTAYKNASQDQAMWLIYNFAFGGHTENDALNQWFDDVYFQKYPSPPRNRPQMQLADDGELTLLKKDQGALPVTFDLDSLVGYLTTQSNIEAAVEQGHTYDAIEQDLRQALSVYELSGHFNYRYTYEIYRFQRSES